jgi:hypothetical protein
MRDQTAPAATAPPLTVHAPAGWMPSAELLAAIAELLVEVPATGHEEDRAVVG